MDFGEGITPFTEGTPMYDLIMTGTAPDGLTAQLLMTEAYDQGYQIFDHDTLDATDPLAIIGMHNAERIWEGSKMFALMDEVVSCKLPEMLNTPLMELMDYPRHVLDRFIKRFKPLAERERNTIRDMDAAIKAQQEAAAKE